LLVVFPFTSLRHRHESSQWLAPLSPPR
jgi:hypothetical protein